MSEKKRALVLGASGVVGRNLLHHLVNVHGWETIAVSRRRPDVVGTYLHLPVDLLNREQTTGKLGRALGVTHVFYTAFCERPSLAEMVAPNLAMLQNIMDAIEPVSPRLTHINLMHGTKWYGNHLGPFKTPAREDDPRHMPPNFYYDQLDWITERQRGKTWTWTAARPHAVCGYATGSPMSLVMVIAVYATISKALGLPLCFPGNHASFSAIYQCTDAELLARSLLWMTQESRCANHSFNVTNGDLFRWEHIWPTIADYFNMKVGPLKKINLTKMMKDKDSLWERLVSANSLTQIPYDQLAVWSYADYVFSTEYDVISSMTKAREFGFNYVVDTEKMFIRLFDDLRARQVIPAC